MSQQSPNRVGTVLALITIPILPLWLAEPAASAFGWDPHAAQLTGGVLALLLFVGMLGIGWEIIRRVHDTYDEK